MDKKKQNIDEIRQVLESMRRDYWQGLEESEGETAESRDFLFFSLGGERFGIGADTVREVVRMPPRLVPVPQVASHIRGIFNLRGRILAVSDLGSLLGLSAGAIRSSSRLLVVEAGGLCTALLAEQVEGLQSIPLAEIEPVTAGLGRFAREETFGQVIEPQGLRVLLNLERIFARPDFVVNEQSD